MRNSSQRLGALLLSALTLTTLGAYALAREGGVPPASGVTAGVGDVGGPSAVTATGDGQRSVGAAVRVAPVAVPQQADRLLAAPAPGPVTLATQLDRHAVLVGGDGLVHVAIDLEAEASDGAPARRPIDMLVVLDISGSMSGDKLAHAKQALHQLLDRLSEVDRFGLVTYESDARVVVPMSPVARPAVPRFHTVVSRLRSAGGTNMSQGLDLALSQLASTRGSGRTARVLLLSDGHANEGDSSRVGLSQRARSIVAREDVLSTMGVGDDFNEDLMTALADTGTGNFYYLSRVAMLARFFDAELRAASETVATAVEVHVSTGAGVELVELGGYPVERTSAGAGEHLVRPGNLYAGQKRRLWATLRAATDRVRELRPGQVRVEFKRDGKPEQLHAPALPTLACVSEPAAFERGIVARVWEDFIATERFARAQAGIGRAISEGSAEDVDREQGAFEQHRALAAKIGSTRVLRQMARLDEEAKEAKKAQEQAPARRRYHAKQAKSRAHFNLRRDAYNDDPTAGM